MSPVTNPCILVAEDDPDDRVLARDAFAGNERATELRFVSDGVELMDYLLRRGPYSDPATAPRPDLVLLDLNLPRRGGREVLEEIKAHPQLRRLPIVVLTTSTAPEDLEGCYELGANSFITKPSSFDELVALARVIEKYWFGVVGLPKADDPAGGRGTNE